MEFALSEEQELLVDSVSKMLSLSCNLDELRSQASGEKTFSDKITEKEGENEKGIILFCICVFRNSNSKIGS